MSEPLLDLLERGMTYAGAVVGGVRTDQRDAPTPCPEFTVEHLVEHLVNGLEWYAGLPVGGPRDPRNVPSVDLTATPYRKAFDAARTSVRANWSPAHLDEEFLMPDGEITGAGITGYTILEVVAHGWDLAAATGQPLWPAPALAEAALELAHGLDEKTLRTPGAMADPAPVAADASPVDRFVAFLGRDPALAHEPVR